MEYLQKFLNILDTTSNIKEAIENRLTAKREYERVTKIAQDLHQCELELKAEEHRLAE